MFTAVAWMVSSSGCGAKNSTPGSSVDANVDAAAVASATPPEVEAGGIVPVDAPTPAAADLAGIEWLEDDLAAATAKATTSNPTKPLLVDMWAGWCHTCLSMRQTVLRDAALASYADRLVWLALDTERPENVALVEKLNMSMWPTFYVLDPADQSVHAVFAGGASVEQFQEFLSDGLASYEAKQAGRDGDGDTAQGWMSKAAAAVAATRFGDAEAALVKALALAPPEWSRRPEALVELIRARYKQDAFDRCAALIFESMEAVTRSKAASVTDFTVYGRRCLDGLSVAQRGRALRDMIAALVNLEGDPQARLSIDDRSDLLYNLRGLYEALDDRDAARAAATRQLKLLSLAAHAAKTPREAMIYAWPRAEVHVYLGEATKLEPELVALHKALPDEYDPPYRLGWLRMKMGDARGAVAPLERAVSLVYGPRKARVWSLLADAYAELGDAPAERQAREGIVTHLRGLPPGLSSKALEKSALEALEAARERSAAMR